MAPKFLRDGMERSRQALLSELLLKAFNLHPVCFLRPCSMSAIARGGSGAGRDMSGKSFIIHCHGSKLTKVLTREQMAQGLQKID